MVSAIDADVQAIEAAAARQAERVTAGIDDIEAYWRQQGLDPTHHELIGPLAWLTIRTPTGADPTVRPRSRSDASVRPPRFRVE